MLGGFLGALGRAGEAPAIEGSVEPQVDSRRFTGGYVNYTKGLNVHEDGGYFCLARGEPRFSDVGDAEIAQVHGVAAAWLEAFRRLGVAAPSRVRGRFAAVLVRPEERKVIAVTDRFATWPVCYSASPHGIRFGERADDVAGTSPAISVQRLFDYLFFHVIPAPATIFEGVHRLPAAHALEWRNGTSVCESYWSPVFADRPTEVLDEQEARFLSLVESAVAREAETGHVGAYLSGGTDSSTIAGMLCKVQGKPAKTYSIGFEAEGYDEMEYARIASRHFGTDHHEYYVTPEDLLDGIPKIARHYDQPFGNSSAVPAWICALRAREDGIDKVLAGDGGDELFGGNERYAKQLVFERYGLIPGILRRLIIEPVSRIPGMDRLPIARKAVSYVQQSRVPLPDRLHRYNLLLRIGIDEVFESSFLARIDANEPFDMQRRWWDSIKAISSVDHMIAFDWKVTLADNDLPKVIGSAELAGLQVGFPLLSDELLEFSLELPPAWKLKGQTLRWFFKHALRDFLPEEILRKQKHGFGLPFGVWTCTNKGLNEFARGTLNDLGSRGIVKRPFLDRLFREYLPIHPGYYGEMVWVLMMLELWLKSRVPDWRLT